ncbi:hypothetical protein [Thermodesulfatator atlanticus]|uniref:hypothetical protein n=1 Tax=Thermodesulfatator atlanticus TaxID=501497 RepID=UPI0003B504C1|nr:hypothetical protein [Thermodesulfatator atlanticus]
MPFYIRAKTYFRYAQEQLGFAEEEKDPARILKFAKEAVFQACRALWAIVQIEAPKEKPSFEKILSELDKACEPWLAREIKRAVKRIEELGKAPSQEGAKEALELARFVVRRTRDVLEPIVGPSERVERHRKLFVR